VVRRNPSPRGPRARARPTAGARPHPPRADRRRADAARPRRRAPPRALVLRPGDGRPRRAARTLPAGGHAGDRVRRAGDRKAHLARVGGAPRGAPGAEARLPLVAG
jgi:hypothetical protein